MGTASVPETPEVLRRQRLYDDSSSCPQSRR